VTLNPPVCHFGASNLAPDTFDQDRGRESDTWIFSGLADACSPPTVRAIERRRVVCWTRTAQLIEVMLEEGLELAQGFGNGVGRRDTFLDGLSNSPIETFYLVRKDNTRAL